MAAIEVGRVCIKTAGREAGEKCVIVEIIDEKFVEVMGASVKNRRCNINHLEPVDETLDVSTDEETIKKDLESVEISKPDPVEELVEETVEEVAEELVDEVAEEIAEEVAEEVAEELVDEVAEEIAEELVEEAVEEVAEEVAEEIAEEVAEEATEDSDASEDEETPKED